MKIIGIYGIFNIANEGIYIGQSRDIIKRWDSNISKLRLNKHYNKKFQDDYNKFGKESFRLVIFEECNLDELNSKERYWISCYKGVAYNVALGGVGENYHCEDTLLKISKSYFTKGNTPWNKGIPCRESTKQKLSKALVGKPGWNKGLPSKVRVPVTHDMIKDVQNGMSNIKFTLKYGYSKTVWTRIRKGKY